MILSCPSCGTRYAVTADSIGGGREVRCAKCAHRWHQAGEVYSGSEDESSPPVTSVLEIKEIPAGSGLPAPLSPRPFPKAMLVAGLAISVVTLLSAAAVFQPQITHTLPTLAPIYETVGLYNAAGLELTDIKITRSSNGPRQYYVVSGILNNRTQRILPVPTIRIRLLDRRGKLYRYWDFAQAGKRMKPGEQLPFTADNLESHRSDIDKVVVELGTPLQLFLRN